MSDENKISKKRILEDMTKASNRLVELCSTVGTRVNIIFTLHETDTINVAANTPIDTTIRMLESQVEYLKENRERLKREIEHDFEAETETELTIFKA